MRKIIYLLGMMLLPSMVYAQGFHYQDIVLINQGGYAKPAPGTINVCLSTATVNPSTHVCSPTTTIYSNITLTTVKTQPFKADANGNFDFYSDAATLMYTVTGVNAAAQTHILTIPCTQDSNNDGCVATNGGVGPKGAPGDVQTNDGAGGFAGGTQLSTLLNGIPPFPGPNPWYDVTKYGAVGDSSSSCSGGTDNLAAFNTVIALVRAAGKGIIFVPEGNYRISGPLLVPGDAGGTSYRFQGQIATYVSGAASMICGNFADYIIKRGTGAAGNMSVEWLTLANLNAAGGGILSNENFAPANLSHNFISAHRGIDLEDSNFNITIDDNTLRCPALTSGSWGAYASGQTTMRSNNIVGCENGIRVAGPENVILDTHVEVNTVGIVLGIDSANANTNCLGCTVIGGRGEANDITIYAANVGSTIVSGFSLQGSINAPAGDSIDGYKIASAYASIFTGLDASGTFSGAAIHTTNNTKNQVTIESVYGQIAGGGGTVWKNDYTGDGVTYFSTNSGLDYTTASDNRIASGTAGSPVKYGGEVDRFTRPDGTLATGNWTAATTMGSITGGGISIDTNQIKGTMGGAYQVDYYTGESFPANSSASITIGVAGDAIGPVVLGSGANLYWLFNFSGNLYLTKYVAGSQTVLLSTADTEMAGDVYTLVPTVSNASTVLKVYKNGSHLTALDYADTSSPLTSGSPGVGIYSNGIARGDDFQANAEQLQQYSPISYIELLAFDFSTDITVGDGAYYFVVPAGFDAKTLVSVSGSVISVGTTNTTDIQLAKCSVVATGDQCSGTVVDMLSTKLTIDSNENKSSTAATPVVINGANATLATDQQIRVDVDATSTTPPKGLIITLGIQ